MFVFAPKFEIDEADVAPAPPGVPPLVAYATRLASHLTAWMGANRRPLGTVVLRSPESSVVVVWITIDGTDGAVDAIERSVTLAELFEGWLEPCAELMKIGIDGTPAAFAAQLAELHDQTLLHFIGKRLVLVRDARPESFFSMKQAWEDAAEIRWAIRGVTKPPKGSHT